MCAQTPELGAFPDKSKAETREDCRYLKYQKREKRAYYINKQVHVKTHT